MVALSDRILALCTSTPRGRSTGCADRSATPPRLALGRLTRGEIIVIVEPSLSNSDAFGMGGEPPHRHKILGPLLRRLMRMGPDGEVNAGVAFRNFGDPSRIAETRADGDHALDPFRVGARDDRIEVALEIGEIEVAVAVDESHAAQAVIQPSIHRLLRAAEKRAPLPLGPACWNWSA